MDDKDDEAGRRKVFELIDGIDFALLTTRAADGGPLHARPMAHRPVDADGTLWFFTRADSRKVSELRAYPAVLVCFADPRKNHFVTLAGESDIVADAAEKKRRWNEIYRAWFPGGPDDDSVATLWRH